MAFENLFKSRKERLYSVRRTAVDERKHLGNNYRDNILRNSISQYIYRSPVMNDFISLLQETLADLIDSVKYLKKYKSYTTKKDDLNI
jgi:hypothetical protein